MAPSTDGRILKRADPSTIQDKFLVGYQAWFTCAGDGPPVHNGHHGWLHWFDKPIPDGGRPTFDAWPDVSSYTSSELFPSPRLTFQDGSPAQLFSSRNPLTVQRHFHWMALHGVDGCFLQRFAGQCDVIDGGNKDIRQLRDEVGARVREAAEKEGRVWAVMYDVSGVKAERIEKVIQTDWMHLLRDEKILESPNYLREGGKVVVALWGFGFAGRGHDPSTVRNIVRYIRSVTPGGAYIMAGTPTHWQTLTGDADPNPGFLPVWYNEFDAISPWTVGRYHDEETVDRFAREKLARDFQALRNPAYTGGRKVDYVPVIFPGGSGLNMSKGKWPFNQQPRDGGRFLWRQVYNVKKLGGGGEGVRLVYGAMWDEYDEGTAFLPVVSKKRELPVQENFLALDADGYDLPSDWYMRIAGFIGELMRDERPVYETFPVKDLQDYWSSRPKYEPEPVLFASSSSSTQPEASSSSAAQEASGSGTQTFEEWCEQEKEVPEDVAPPPYSLEAESTSTVGEISDSVGQQQQGLQQQPPIPVQSRPALLHSQLPSASSQSISSSYGTSGRPGSNERPPVAISSRPSVSGHGYGSNSGISNAVVSHASVHGSPQRPSQGLSEGTSSSRPALSTPSFSSPSVSSLNSSPSVPHQTRPSGAAQAQAQAHAMHSRTSSGTGASVAPGEVFRYDDYAPAYLQQPNWNTRPNPNSQLRHQQSYHGEMGNLNERFGQQTITDMSSSYGASSPTLPQTIRPSVSVGSSATTCANTGTMQWPPPEWGIPSQSQYRPTQGQGPPRPPSSSRPAPPSLPPQQPSHRPPPPLPLRAGSTFAVPHVHESPNAVGLPMPSPSSNPASGFGIGVGGGWNGDPEYARASASASASNFPVPQQQTPPHPYAAHMVPPSPHRKQSGIGGSPSGSPSAPQAMRLPSEPSSAYSSPYSSPRTSAYGMPEPSGLGQKSEYEYRSEYTEENGRRNGAGVSAGGFVAHTSLPSTLRPSYSYSPDYHSGSGSNFDVGGLAPPVTVESGYPPQIAPRPQSLSPGSQIPLPSPLPSPTPQPTQSSTLPPAQRSPSPGGFIPSRLPSFTSSNNTYARTFNNAMEKFSDVSSQTRKKVECGIGGMTGEAKKKVEGGLGSLSGASARVYQRFRG